MALLPATLLALFPFAAHADRQFDQCLEKLRNQADAHGVTVNTFDTHTRALTPDMGVVELLDYQPEFRTPVWDYMAGLVDQERIDEGRAKLEKWADALDRIEAEYGVDREAIVAIWGIESNYGKGLGKRDVVQSLATLSCYGRRQDFFRGELFNTLEIIQAGDVDPDGLVGSWAGAFGHTQFMPSTFKRIAVDFDGDGRRDLMQSVPDALASTANYLSTSNWRQGEPWGFEVRLPADFDTSGASRKNKRALKTWAARGVERSDGAPLPEEGPSAGLLLPAGESGPAFLVMRNFDALFSYNHSENYALAIANLSDRLRGRGAFDASWPTDDPGLSRAERREVQQRLLDMGHDIGEVDGMIGSRTREAIKQLQPELGMEADGRAGQRLLRALRERE